MAHAKKRYEFKGIEVILESSADNEMPTVMLHVSAKGPLDVAGVASLKIQLIRLLVSAYNASELTTRNQQFNGKDSTGFQISFANPNSSEPPTPNEFLAIATRWLDTLEEKVMGSSTFGEGFSQTMDLIQKQNLSHGKETADEDGETKWQASNPDDIDALIGRIGFNIHFHKMDEGRFTLSFDENAYAIDNIKIIADTLAKAITTHLNQNKIPTKYYKPAGSNDLSYDFLLNDATSLKEVSHKLLKLLVSITAKGKRFRDEEAAIAAVLQEMALNDETTIKLQVKSALADTLKTLLKNDPALLSKKDEIAEAALAAALKPFKDFPEALAAMHTDKGEADPARIRARIKDSLSAYLAAEGTDGKKTYYAAELAAALDAAIPKKETSQKPAR